VTVLAAQEDPLSRVLALESSSFRRGLTIGIIGALVVHVAGASEAMRLANGLGGWARDTRSDIHEYFARLYDVEMVNAPPPPPPPAPEEKPEPEAPKPVALAPKSAPKEAPAPAPAQAGKILAQEPDPDAPVDLTGAGFVTGNADSYAGGVTASTGTSKKAVRDLAATPGGVPGGTGTKPGPAVAASDMSQPPSLIGGTNWEDCPFPPEADADQIDLAKVTVVVTVKSNGSAQDVRVVTDPGHGFGREARRCAMRKRFEPAKDREGRPMLGTMPPFTVRFER
jgi:protein TonB